ncbi:MAG: DUF3040 domain-containing protein [Actinobacteria bacterium]|uniref:Unannotated protein n=1 Tax=freshwater metagenome TaxID=449393 RepID=A0A6J6NT51_9ZZZZ|nr:DUF3040 domain-containing protein [Actinomycetota bacterium]
MPLSEEELRLLEQMERALSEEDPKFASTLRGTSLRRAARRRAIAAGVVFVVGIVIMMTGVVIALPPVGIAGFLVMLASAVVGLSAVRGQQTAGPIDAAAGGSHPSRGFTVHEGGRSGRTRRPRRSGTFMERMDARWQRRREDNGGF